MTPREGTKGASQARYSGLSAGASDEAIQTARLLIRKPRLSDAAACARQLNNLEISRWLGMVPYPYTLSDAVDFIEGYSDAFPKSGFLFEGDALIGGIGLDAELGYWLAPEAWGKGYASEAAAAVLAYHFARSTDEFVHSSYHAGNIRSKNVLAKLGFKPAGQDKSTPRATGLEVDLYRVTLTRADWEARS